MVLELKSYLVHRRIEINSPFKELNTESFDRQSDVSVRKSIDLDPFYSRLRRCLHAFVFFFPFLSLFFPSLPLLFKGFVSFCISIQTSFSMIIRNVSITDSLPGNIKIRIWRREHARHGKGIKFFPTFWKIEEGRDRQIDRQKQGGRIVINDPFGWLIRRKIDLLCSEWKRWVDCPFWKIMHCMQLRSAVASLPRSRMTNNCEASGVLICWKWIFRVNSVKVFRFFYCNLVLIKFPVMFEEKLAKDWSSKRVFRTFLRTK